MVNIKKVFVYTVSILITGCIGTILVIKTSSKVLENMQDVVLAEQRLESKSEPIKNGSTIDSGKEIINDEQPYTPIAIPIEQGGFPNQKELQSYLWWSEGSNHAVKFTEQYQQSLRLAENMITEDIISLIPYQVDGNILSYDYSQMDNPMNIEQHPSMVLSWRGNKLVLIPNDSCGYKEERTETLIPIERIN